MSKISISTIAEESEGSNIKNFKSFTGIFENLGDYRESNPEIRIRSRTALDELGSEVKLVSTESGCSITSSILHLSDPHFTYHVENDLSEPDVDWENSTKPLQSEEFTPLTVIHDPDEYCSREVFHDDNFKPHFEKQVYDQTTNTDTKYCRVIGEEVLNHSQEPWPKDVKLFQPREVEQILLPDNANCLAVQTFLKMCGLEYKVEPRANAEAMSPTGKVPFIKCGAFIVSELESIVQFVGNKGFSLTQDMSTENKSDMRAYMTLVNNVLGNAELYICWIDNETYQEVSKQRYGCIYPWPLNHIQAWSKRNAEIKRLKVLGWYEKSLEEVYGDVETCCQALTDRLDGNEFFFGSNPTELEALIFGHLYTILTTPLPNAALANTVKNFPELITLITKLEKKYFQRETQHHGQGDMAQSQ